MSWLSDAVQGKKSGGGGGNPLAGIIGGGGGSSPLGGLLGGGGGGSPLSMIGGGGGGGLGGLLGMIGGGGGGSPLGGLFGGGIGNGNMGNGPFGQIPGFNSTYNPLGNGQGGMFGNKQHVDTTGQAQEMIDKFKSQNPYNSALSGPGGTLGSQFQMQAGPAVKAGQISAPGAVKAGSVTSGLLDTKKLAANQQSMNTLRDKANATGPSAWAQLAQKQNSQDLLGARDLAGANAMSGANSAQDQLAMRGGLGGGASERIAQNMGRDANAARQGAQRNFTNANLGILSQDEQNKNSLLGQSAGLDLQNAGFNADLAKTNIANTNQSNQFNVGSNLDASKFNAGAALDAQKANAANNLQAGEFNSTAQQNTNAANATNTLGAFNANNAQNMNMLQTQLAGFGAARSADATQNAGKK